MVNEEKDGISWSSFERYCENTSLHGWQYIYKSSSRSGWRSLWMVMVITSVIVACCFVFKQASEFNNATVVTTVDTMTAPLTQVFFPSVTICNINQVRRSFLEELGVFNNWTTVDLLFREFYTGSDHKLTEHERHIMEGLFSSEFYVKREIEYNFISNLGSANESTYEKWKEYLDKYRRYIVGGTHFTNFAVQEPGGIMILSAKFEGQTKSGECSDFNPYFGTDTGICAIIKPQLNFDPSLDHLPFWRKLFSKTKEVQRGSEVGKANGLTVLLDAETFDYTYHLRAGEGFKLSVHHHLDQPIMSIKEIDISVGSESQVAVATTLTTTTDEARARFNPIERGCYFEGELNLKYLPNNTYRYEMSNCLFEAAYEEILHRCNCTPSFHLVAYEEYPSICSGHKLTCMSKILTEIGKFNQVGVHGTNGKEPSHCLAACEDQINLVTETSSSFPNSQTFHRREEFCLVVRKLLKTCMSPKATALTIKFPLLCSHLFRIDEIKWRNLTGHTKYGDQYDEASCKICPSGVWNPKADHPELTTGDGIIDVLNEEIFTYAKQNLALVNIYIKDPVVTRIKRDQKITVIGFVANTGGLLGLCMGFSLVSAFEILYHILISFCKYFERTISTNLDKLKRGMKCLPPPSPSQTTTTSQPHQPELSDTSNQQPMTDLVIAVTSNETRVVAAASIKTKDVKCRSNSSVRAAKLVVCRKSRLPQAERPAVMNYTSNEGSLHQSTPEPTTGGSEVILGTKTLPKTSPAPSTTSYKFQNGTKPINGYPRGSDQITGPSKSEKSTNKIRLTNV